MPITQKVAIARIISDLIKADDIIEKSEIDKFNSLKRVYNITGDDLVDAQQIRLTDAFEVVRLMPDREKRKLEKHLLDTAQADSACVAREALILLSLKLILNGKKDKYQMVSFDTVGSYSNSKYAIYVSSEENKSINTYIEKEYDHIVNLFKLWGFDFIYLPKFAKKLQELNEQNDNYVVEIIKYMNPGLTEEQVADLYRKLTNIKTEEFCNRVLVQDRKLPIFHTIKPSLMINIGTSVVPYCTQSGDSIDSKTYTEFLVIRLDETEKDVILKEVRYFLEQYQEIITEPEYYRPDRRRNYFKYFGFYKMLFDFMSRMEAEPKIEIELKNKKIWMSGHEVKLSETQLAAYLLILYQTHFTRHRGLLRFEGKRKPVKWDDKSYKDITESYRTIFTKIRSNGESKLRYIDENSNIPSYITRINSKITENLKGKVKKMDIFMPIIGDDKYIISFEPANIFVKYKKAGAATEKSWSFEDFIRDILNLNIY